MSSNYQSIGIHSNSCRFIDFDYLSMMLPFLHLVMCSLWQLAFCHFGALSSFFTLVNQLQRLGGSEIQYWTFTASELTTSVLGPANQNRAVKHQTEPASNKMPPSIAEAKLNVTAVMGYTVGSVKITTQNISHVKDTHPTGALHLHGRSKISPVSQSAR
jgi:hypothetical protein